VISTLITITPGSTSVPVTVAVYDDPNFDAIGFKNFSLVLSTNENAARITNDTTVVVVFDNDCKLNLIVCLNGCFFGVRTPLYFSWTVLVPPPAVDVAAPASVQDGESATFGCIVRASSANITVFWLDGNGKMIDT
jgi:hypothetical protein